MRKSVVHPIIKARLWRAHLSVADSPPKKCPPPSRSMSRVQRLGSRYGGCLTRVSSSWPARKRPTFSLSALRDVEEPPRTGKTHLYVSLRTGVKSRATDNIFRSIPLQRSLLPGAKGGEGEIFCGLFLDLNLEVEKVMGRAGCPQIITPQNYLDRHGSTARKASVCFDPFFTMQRAWCLVKC